MADAFVWIRCLGCKEVTRLVSFLGDWGRAGDTDWFIDKHMSERCHPGKVYSEDSSEEGYAFFEIVTERRADEEGGINAPLDALDAARGGH